ncbi:hypothetical protein DPMN_165863 [Dreissena polymorpha]|uniref:Uncharacterized protein n=1 Tax=Dreissena polymorpha TaxID=45954 RepID=A0A9D4EW53_DREPO|nr:hypothetical protein DPMN_165863 [Dreissena polymorpha]
MSSERWLTGWSKKGSLREEKFQVYRAARSLQPKRLTYLVVPIEEGVTWFCAQFVCRLMSAVQSTGRNKRQTIQKLSQAAERSSRLLWLRRDDAAWKK